MEMLQKKKGFLALAIIIILMIVGVAFLQYWQGRNPNGNVHNADNEVKSKRKDPSFKIIADTLTETGRVYRVSKAGEEWSIVLPRDIKATPEELENMMPPPRQAPPSSFDPSKPPKEWNRQLTFYGVVYDQTTNEVAGATIKGSAIVAPVKSTSRSETVTTTSDVHGRFKLEVEWGQQISVYVSKSNYLSPEVMKFYYSLIGTPRHEPNELTPVAFFLQEKKTENLITYNRRYRISHDGTPARLDLSTGLLVEKGGDLIVSIYCPEEYTNLKPIPWKLMIQAVDGGLAEVGEDISFDYMHEAPLTGYKPSILVEYATNSSPYRSQYEGLFYVNSRNGQSFAKVRFDTHTRWDERGIPFGVSVAVNTNASRTLQTQKY